MSRPEAPIYTFGLRPDLFPTSVRFAMGRVPTILILAILVIGGFAFRVAGLSAEGLSEDELNKLNAVQDYREHGITGANGEHPMFMKALITVSLVASESWNRLGFVQADPSRFQVSTEAAVRLPSVIFGALTPLLIFILLSELFGPDVAFIAAALWALDPNAIGFNRIAKEDTFVLFFLLLANCFWIKGQRVAELEPARNPERYYWATGAAYGAMVASKYLPYLVVIGIAYNYMWQGMKATRWRIGRKRFLKLFIVMGIAFLLLNPPILLPETWHQMFSFASYKLVGHDSYEFMGRFYPHRLTSWLAGVPWYFYFFYMWVKMPLISLGAFLLGLVLLFKKRTSDGRYFILFWLFFWFFVFSALGGKFTRYFTVGYAAVLITAGIGIEFLAELVSGRLSSSANGLSILKGLFALLAISGSVFASAFAYPHYRLYQNPLGGGKEAAGTYFPHDEFYDASVRDVVRIIGARARPGARVASETPELADFYGDKLGRTDLQNISTSDPEDISRLEIGDYIVFARGRRYLSNQELLIALKSFSPADVVTINGIESAEIFIVNADLRTKLAQCCMLK